MSRLIAALKTNFWIENRRDISIQPARITEREQISAVTPEGSHPIPSRTRKLRPPGPMVLQGKPCGRVGRRRELLKARILTGSGPFFCAVRGGFSNTSRLEGRTHDRGTAAGFAHPRRARKRPRLIP